VPSAEIKDGAIIFRFLTFKQMEKIRILGEDVYITFRLAYDNDEEEITLLTTSDSTLPNEWIDAVGFAYENNVKDSISVEVGTDIASKIDTIEIDGLFGNLLTADATWRLAEIENKVDNIKLPEIDTTDIASKDLERFFGVKPIEGYEFMTAEEYIKAYDGNLSSNIWGHDIEIEIVDEEDENEDSDTFYSKAWVSKVLGLKYQAIDQAGHVLASSTEDDRKKAITELVNKLSENETYSFWYDPEDNCIYTCEGESNKNADDLECIDIISI
jgi:hypothetical protein